MEYIMLACETIKSEVISSLNEANADIPVLFIPSNFHMSPKKMHSYLQEIINSFYNVKHVLLTMGICGNGTLKLTSSNTTIILPKCADCVEILMSEKSGVINRPDNSYFLTESWLNGKFSITEEYSFTVEKYGRKMADEIMRTIYKGYKYFTFLDTGTYDIEPLRKRVQALADTVGMEINVIKSEYGLLRKMAKLDFNKQFVIISPGEAVSVEHFGLFDEQR